MTRMLLVTDVHESIKRHQAQIISSLKDPDIRYLHVKSPNIVYNLSFSRTGETLVLIGVYVCKDVVFHLNLSSGGSYAAV
jgi:hypothetical protein